jgi:hypothetical protein
MTGPVRHTLTMCEKMIEFPVTGSPRVGYELNSPILGTPKPLKRANALSNSAGSFTLAHLNDNEGRI